MAVRVRETRSPTRHAGARRRARAVTRALISVANSDARVARAVLEPVKYSAHAVRVNAARGGRTYAIAHCARVCEGVCVRGCENMSDSEGVPLDESTLARRNLTAASRACLLRVRAMLADDPAEFRIAAPVQSTGGRVITASEFAFDYRRRPRQSGARRPRERTRSRPTELPHK